MIIIEFSPASVTKFLPLVERREKQSIGCCAFMSKVFNE